LDSGYLGSPASSGLVSHNSQSLAEYLLTSGSTQYDGEEASRLPDGAGNKLKLEDARAELDRLMAATQASEKFLRSASLPSFPECFPVISLPEYQRAGPTSSQLTGGGPEPTTVEEELDALDEEIKRIVGEATDGSSFFPSGNHQECLRPRPIRSNPFTNDQAERPSLLGRLGPSIESQVDEGVEEEEEEEDEEEENGSRIMLAVVSTVSQTYQTPRSSLPFGLTAPSRTLSEHGSVLRQTGDLSEKCAAEDKAYVANVLSVRNQDIGVRTALSSYNSTTSSELGRSNPDPSHAAGSPRFIFKKTSQFSGK
jgi:hypothetical protein